jgi:hypothetical protein
MCSSSPTEIHDYVDSKRNCEDIALNMLITGISGAAPVHVHSEAVWDYGTFQGISTIEGHGESRSDCVNDLAALLGRVTLADSKLSVWTM